jgi:hypothetical protein
MAANNSNNNNREKELIKREEAIADKEQELKDKEQELKEKELSLEVSESDLVTKESEILASLRSLENLKAIEQKGGLPNITVVGAVRHNVDTSKITPKVGAKQTRVLSDGTVIEY